MPTLLERLVPGVGVDVMVELGACDEALAHVNATHTVQLFLPGLGHLKGLSPVWVLM